MGTGIGDDEQSLPSRARVKERRGSRGRPRRSKSGGRGGEKKGERERERLGRNNGRIILPGYFSK